LANGYDFDGNGIADFDGTVRIWKRNGQSFDLDRELPGEETDRVYGLAFDPKSTLIAATRGDGVATIWKMNTGEQISTFTNHANWVWSAAFSPESTMVVTTGSKDETARLWEPRARGREMLVLRGHETFVASAVFSPHGRFVLTVGDDETARVWDLNARQPVNQTDQEQMHSVKPNDDPSLRPPVKRLPCSGQQHQQCWTRAIASPDRRYIVTFNDQEQSETTAEVWNMATGESVLALDTYKDGVRDAAWSSDGRFIVLLDAMGNTTKLWDIQTGRKIDLTGHTSRVSHAAFSPSNACIVTGSLEGTDGTVRIWQTSTGINMTTFWGYAQGVAAVAFDPRSKTVIVQSQDHTVWTHAAEGCASTAELLPIAQKYVERNMKWHFAKTEQ
jgi:WD40 repeat protein